MNRSTKNRELYSGFLHKSALGVAVTAILILTPFSINNFLQGRYMLGWGSLSIVAILTFIAWNIHRGRYYPSVTLYGLLPATVVFLSLSIQDQGIVGALWISPCVISFYFTLPERKAWLANTIILVVALPQIWMVLDYALAARVVATVLAVSAFSAIFVRIITAQQKQLQALAMTDSLTGLFNRVLLDDSLIQAIEFNQRTNTAMTLVALDMDHFKAINDSLGHDAGDTVLRSVGELLRKRIRRSDKAFRLGGEEFLILLYGTDKNNGRRFAEELREAVAGLQLLPDNVVTISAGVATLQPGEDWMEWIKRGDEHLYRAKSTGRNRVAA